MSFQWQHYEHMDWQGKTSRYMLRFLFLFNFTWALDISLPFLNFFIFGNYNRITSFSFPLSKASHIPTSTPFQIRGLFLAATHIYAWTGAFKKDILQRLWELFNSLAYNSWLTSYQTDSQGICHWSFSTYLSLISSGATSDFAHHIHMLASLFLLRCHDYFYLRFSNVASLPTIGLKEIPP